MMTYLKASAFLLMGLVLGAGLPACGSLRLNIKTWYLDVDQAEAIKPAGVLIRKHTNAATEVLDRTESKSYRCVNQKDYDLLISLAKQAGIRGIN
jgi:hypothetical protein